MGDSETTELLRRWAQGEADALIKLLELHLDWLKAAVRKRLGPGLRQKLESGDVVQEAIMDFLNDGPRLQCKSGDDFRKFMTRVILNVLADESKWYTAKRRDIAREFRLDDAPSPPDGRPTPFTAAAQSEDFNQIRLVLEVLPPHDQRVLMLREWDGLPFEDIASALSVSYDAARMRHARAMQRLREGMQAFRDRGVDSLLAATEDP